MENTDQSVLTVDQILWPSAQLGALTGTCGLLFGGTLGVIRSRQHPLATSLAFGANYFVLGSVFWASRQSILQYQILNGPALRPFQNHGARDQAENSLDETTRQLNASSYGAGLAGFTSSVVLRASTLVGDMAPDVTMQRRLQLELVRFGRGCFMGVFWACLGYWGQKFYNALNAQRAVEEAARLNRVGPPPNIWQRLAGSSWSPVKPLSDEEYLNILRERLLRMDVEISVIDDNIKKLKEEQSKMPKEERK